MSQTVRARRTPRVKGNRLVKAKRRVDAFTVIATYAYDGANRRVSKVVANSGVEFVANDGGNQTVHFYYGDVHGTGLPWNIFETRNGSNQTTRQWVWGTRYIDEIILMDVNGVPSASNDCDIDNTASGETGPTESPADHRYIYHQDRNWNVVALTDYSPPNAVTNNCGKIVERYSYTPYGDCSTFASVVGTSELARLVMTSTLGSPLAHHGLGFEHETNTYSNRQRQYHPAHARFAQLDTLPTHLASAIARVRDFALPAKLQSEAGIAYLRFVDGMSAYQYVKSNPLRERDPIGLQCPPPNGCSSPFGSLGIPGWTTCCNSHDYCYCDCRSTRSACDDTFRDCLEDRCRDSANSYLLCLWWAQRYHQGVHYFGASARCARQRAANCCPLPPECTPPPPPPPDLIPGVTG